MRDLQRPGRSPIYSTNGMAATSHALASETAIAILREGGNAMDAAIAACAVQCIVEPGSTGIGGDNFCLYAPRGKASDIVAYDGSGRAPAAASVAKLKAMGVEHLTRTSPHSVTVPGAVDAWCRLNDDHGTMPMSAILQPAIDLARQGYPVSPRVHFDWASGEAHLRSDPVLEAIYLPGGKVPEIGALHRQPQLAEALEIIGREGRRPFYEGELAADVLAALKDRGGLHTAQDFASAEGNYVTPINGDFAGQGIFQCPPAGQGVIALLMLNMFAHGPKDDPISEERLHFELEACRRAYAARGLYLADPARHAVPVAQLLDPAYAKRLADDIGEKAGHPQQDLLAVTPHEDTVTIQVVDKDRNACSFINTVFWGWGGGITSPKYGIVLTNRGEGFVMEEGHPNAIEGGKRPLHTIIPGMAVEGDAVTLSYGVMGGEYQAMGHAQFLSRMAHFGMDIQQAQDAPRWMVDPFTGVAEIETPIDADMLDALRRRGHRIDYARRPIGGSQAIAINPKTGVLTGGSDPRKDGCAIGY